MTEPSQKLTKRSNSAAHRRGANGRGTASRARILEAAEAEFAQRGFSGATTAAIAAGAGVPKANLHYHFRTKRALYRAVLENILEEWLATGDQIRPEADPAEAFATYIAAKIAASRRRPNASKVFANELLHGAPQLKDYLRGAVRRWVEERQRVIEGWVADGQLAPVDVPHLFFVIWAATQTYADFAVQMGAVLGRSRLTPADYDTATELVTDMVLARCGLPRRRARGLAAE